MTAVSMGWSWRRWPHGSKDLGVSRHQSDSKLPLRRGKTQPRPGVELRPDGVGPPPAPVAVQDVKLATVERLSADLRQLLDLRANCFRLSRAHQRRPQSLDGFLIDQAGR